MLRIYLVLKSTRFRTLMCGRIKLCAILYILLAMVVLVIAHAVLEMWSHLKISVDSFYLRV